MVTCSIVDENLELSVIDVDNRTLLAFESHVVGFSKLVLHEAGDYVGFSDFFWALLQSINTKTT